MCARPRSPNFTCSGANIATQTINEDDATVVTVDGFSVDTTAVGGSGGNAITITGEGELSYTDVYMSPLTAEYTGLYIRSTDDSDEPGSVTINTNGDIEGGDNYDGIYARNDGSGAISITANGNISGEIESGIFARNAGTSLSVVTGGTVEADDFGIQARNYGDAALTIETDGDVTGSALYGIFARNEGTTLSVTTAGTTSGGTGIRAQNDGSQALTVTANGDVTGTGGYGIYAQNGTGLIPFGNGLTVTTDAGTTVYGSAGGILARDYGDGATTVTANGNVTGAGGYGIYARGDGTNLNVTTGGTIMGMGNGTFGGLTFTGGVLAPGNSIGAITVNGPISLGSGAVYEVEVNAKGQNDKVIVMGTVSLTGSVLRVLAANGNYKTSTNYTIIQNDGTDAVVGTFAKVTSSLAFLTPTVFYTGGDGNDVVLNLERNATLFVDVARTFNQRAVAGALSQFPTSNALFFAVLNQRRRARVRRSMRCQARFMPRWPARCRRQPLCARGGAGAADAGKPCER